MKHMGYFRNLFQGTRFGAPMPLAQAGGGSTTSTPVPRLDDYSYDGSNQSTQFFALDGPTPAQIEWLVSLSDELGRTISRIRTEVWRRGLQVTPKHPKFCSQCKEGLDEEVADEEKVECHLCHFVGPAMDPDPAEKSRLEDFALMANRVFREDLTSVGERKTEEMLKHGRSYMVFQMAYDYKENGVIDTAVVKGVYAGSSARIFPLYHKETGLPGGAYICIRCRVKPGYKAREHPGNCDCGFVLYEATYVQNASIFGGSHNMFWLPEEVHETKWPYKDGTGPVRRLWPKVSTMLMMDWYAAWALDPKKDKRPDKILVTMGGDVKSIIDQLKANAELRKKNPYAYTHLHMPSPPGGLGEVKLGAEILDFGDKEFKGQMLDLRQKFEDATRQQYGLSSLSAGDDQTGGLGQNDQPKLRTTAQVAEDIQRLEQKGLERLAQKLGATQWTYTFHPALEEDDARKADDTGKWLDVATKAAAAGLAVEWRAGKPHIQDGPVQNPMAQQGGVDENGNPLGGEFADEDLPELDEDEDLEQDEGGDLGEGPDGVPITQRKME